MRALWLLLWLLLSTTGWTMQQQPATTEPAQKPASTEPQPASTEPQPASTDTQPATPPGDLPPPDYQPYQPSDEPPPNLDRSDLYVNTFGSLLFVLALIVIIGWAARRFLFEKMGVASKAQGRMYVVQNLPLGTRRHVSLIEVDGKRFLLGVTDHQVNLIKALDELDFDDAMAAVNEPPPTVSQLMGEES